MARRKKHTKRRTSRRRRVSGINPTNLLTTVAGVAVGAAAAGFIVNKFLGTQSDTIKGIVPIAAGIALPMALKGDLGQAAGSGMIAVGVSKFLAKAGLGATDDYTIPVNVGAFDYAIAGDDFAMAGDDYAMAGDDNISVLAGIDDDM
jgi:hypothetical protein